MTSFIGYRINAKGKLLKYFVHMRGSSQFTTIKDLMFMHDSGTYIHQNLP